jgi:hypothetical protein
MDEANVDVANVSQFDDSLSDVTDDDRRRDGTVNETDIFDDGDDDDDDDDDEDDADDDDDDDDNDGGDDDDEAVSLSWRDDPMATFSDFKIEVVTVPCDGSLVLEAAGGNTYHVHKAILAVGARKSVYFKRLFTNVEFRENANDVSRIELHPRSAEAFPQLLDYMYNHWQPFQFDSQNVLPLYELGQYFIVPQLVVDAREFWTRDLRPENCHVYYEKANFCGKSCEVVVEAIEDICVKRSQEVAKNKTLFHLTPPQFWLRLLKNSTRKVFGSDKAGDMCNVSNVLIGTLVEERAMECFNVDLFSALTDTVILPVVHSTATALTLIQYEILVCGAISASMTNLQRRCMDALKKRLAEIPDVSSRAEFQQKTLDHLQMIDPPLVQTFLAEALERERERVAELEVQVAELEEQVRCPRRRGYRGSPCFER